MRKPAFFLCGSAARLPIFKPLAIFCGCTAWFLSDLVGNLEDRFSRNKAHFTLCQMHEPYESYLQMFDTGYSDESLIAKTFGG